MGVALGAEKEFFFLRGRGPPVYGCACGILSIPAQQCPWGRLGSVVYTCRLPHTPPFNHSWPISLSRPQRDSFFPWLLQGSSTRLCIDGVCSPGATHYQTLAEKTYGSRSAPKKCVQFGPITPRSRDGRADAGSDARRSERALDALGADACAGGQPTGKPALAPTPAPTPCTPCTTQADCGGVEICDVSARAMAPTSATPSRGCCTWPL